MAGENTVGDAAWESACDLAVTDVHGLAFPSWSAAASKCKCRSRESSVRCPVSHVTPSDNLVEADSSSVEDDNAVGIHPADYKEPTAAEHTRSRSDIFYGGASVGANMNAILFVCVCLRVHTREACQNHLEVDWW